MLRTVNKELLIVISNYSMMITKRPKLAIDYRICELGHPRRITNIIFSAFAQGETGESFPEKKILMGLRWNWALRSKQAKPYEGIRPYFEEEASVELNSVGKLQISSGIASKTTPKNDNYVNKSKKYKIGH